MGKKLNSLRKQVAAIEKELKALKATVAGFGKSKPAGKKAKARKAMTKAKPAAKTPAGKAKPAAKPVAKPKPKRKAKAKAQRPAAAKAPRTRIPALEVRTAPTVAEIAAPLPDEDDAAGTGVA